MKRTLLALALGTTVLRPAASQGARSDSAAAMAAIDAFHAALHAGDSARAVGQLAEDAVIIEAGTIETRAQYLSGHIGADIKASGGTPGVRTVVAATVVGSVAFVTARTVTTTTTAQGASISELAELMVVAKSDGTWKIRAVHWSSRRRRASPSV